MCSFIHQVVPSKKNILSLCFSSNSLLLVEVMGEVIVNPVLDSIRDLSVICSRFQNYQSYVVDSLRRLLFNEYHNGLSQLSTSTVQLFSGFRRHEAIVNAST